MAPKEERHVKFRFIMRRCRDDTDAIRRAARLSHWSSGKFDSGFGWAGNRDCIDKTSDSRIELARHYIPAAKQNFAVPPGTLGRLGLSLLLALDVKVFELGFSVAKLFGTIKTAIELHDASSIGVE